MWILHTAEDEMVEDKKMFVCLFKFPAIQQTFWAELSFFEQG